MRNARFSRSARRPRNQRTEDGVGFRSGSDDGRRICALDIRTLRCATEMVQQWAIPNLETQTGICGWVASECCVSEFFLFRLRFFGLLDLALSTKKLREDKNTHIEI